MARSAGKAAGSGTTGVTARAKKISITVDEGVLAAVQKQAKRRGQTLSAHITEALERDLRRVRLAELLAAEEAKQGAVTDDELAAVRTQWRA
jgi:ribosomal protein L15